MFGETLKLAGRAIEEYLFRDEVILREPPSGPGTLNMSTAQVTFPTPREIYRGPCRREPTGGRSSDVEGEEQVDREQIVLRLPSVPKGLRIGQLATFPCDEGEADQWEIISAPPATDRMTHPVILRRVTGAWTTS